MINIRNFGIIAHIDAGKTTTTERLLFSAGASRYLGEVEEGTTVTDYLYEERERGITIQSAVAKCLWKDTTFHIIDTPGHVDFMNEVECCLQVLDAAVVVVCGQAGIQAQTENLLRADSMKNKPLIFYINKLDKESADFERVFYEIQEQYPVLPLAFPYYKEDKFVGIIDVLSEKLVVQDGLKQDCLPLPEDAKDLFDFYYTLLVDTLTEHDEKLLENVLGGNVNKELIIKSLRTLTIEQKIMPLLCGSSKKNAGISLLADGIKSFFPAPNDIDDNKKIPDVFCFKYMAHQELGRLRLIKINKNIILNKGSKLYSAGTGETVVIDKIYTPFGGLLDEEDEVKEGQIAIIQEEQNETLASSALYINHDEAIKNENCEIFKQYPIIFLKIEPENPENREKLLNVGKFLLQEDATLLLKEDCETGEIILGGMGELHLEIFRDRLEHSYKIKTRAGQPAVIPKLVPAKNATLTESSSFVIQNQEIQATLSLEISSISEEKMLFSEKLENILDIGETFSQSKEILRSLLITGKEYEFINTKVRILNFETSSPLVSLGLYCSVFSRLASKIIKDMDVELLYPQMELEIFVKPEYTGNITGEIQARHGTVCDISRIDSFDRISSYAPMEELFGFATRLRSLSCGHGAFSMKLSGYAPKSHKQQKI